MEFDQLLRSLKDNPDEVEFNDVMIRMNSHRPNLPMVIW